MFIDDLNKNYTYLNEARSIVWEQPSSESRHCTRVTACPELQDIIDRLMKKRPTWRFKSTSHGSSGYALELVNFEIWDAEEKLGSMWRESHWRDGSYRIYFENFRLSASRKRRSSNYTTKPYVAAKRILEAFHLKTPSERAAALHSEVNSKRGEITREGSWPLQRAQGTINKLMQEYAVRNWDTLKPLLGPGAADIDLTALVREDEKMKRLTKRCEMGAAINLRIEGNGTYLTMRPGANVEIETFTDATMSDHICGALGLLKLLEDGTYVEGVGMRVDARTYLIMDKEEGV